MFKKIAAIMAVGMLAFALSGCALWSELTGSDTTASARAAASVVLATYRDTYQPALLVYGKLPTCSAIVATSCKDAATWAKLKAVDLATETTIEGVRSLLAGTDTSTDTVSKIEAATAAIQSAITKIKAAGVTSTTTSTSSGS
jgi:hypothetical protein